MSRYRYGVPEVARAMGSGCTTIEYYENGKWVEI